MSKLLSFIIVSKGIVLLLITHATAKNVGEISKKKCQDYASAVYTIQDSLVFSHHQQVRVSQCGIVSVPLIVGGEEALEKEFPHMALIGYGAHPLDKLEWQCGGSLISERFILTAAHCMLSREHGPAQKAKLGITKLDHEEDMLEVTISERIQHPLYTPPFKYNDIGLLKLSEDVKFTPFARPACLNTDQHIRNQSSVTATGFGKLTYESSDGSDVLMKVQLTVYPNQECNRIFSEPVYRIILPESVTNSMICSGDLSGGKDTCQGDSGGPLQTVLEEPYCMYSLIGITSFGQYCGFANSLGVYTRISYYLSWIEDTVWG